jgi:hypothetical protein
MACPETQARRLSTSVTFSSAPSAFTPIASANIRTIDAMKTVRDSGPNLDSFNSYLLLPIFFRLSLPTVNALLLRAIVHHLLSEFSISIALEDELRAQDQCIAHALALDDLILDPGEVDQQGREVQPRTGGEPQLPALGEVGPPADPDDIEV